MLVMHEIYSPRKKLHTPVRLFSGLTLKSIFLFQFVLHEYSQVGWMEPLKAELLPILSREARVTSNRTLCIILKDSSDSGVYI